MTVLSTNVKQKEEKNKTEKLELEPREWENYLERMRSVRVLFILNPIDEVED